jgi:cation:H+ antiporter
VLAVLAGVALIVWGAEIFARHLAVASTRLGVSAFAMAILLAGAEPEELATVVTASVRDAPGIAFGDVIGANIAVCLIALGAGALVAPLPFGRGVRLYGLLAVPAGVLAAALAWDGEVGRPEGVLLVASYGAYVALIWIRERRPPTLGETGELADVGESERDPTTRMGVELVAVVGGVLAMAIGAVLLVEAVRQLTDVERSQTILGLTVVGFATAFELVVLAFTSARHGVSEAVVAAVVGSFAYNATMTLGAGAVVRPLHLIDATQLHGPWLAMVGSLVLALALALPAGRLSRRGGVVLLATYPLLLAGLALR